MGWLDDALSQCRLTDEVEGYLLGRGAKEEFIQQEGIVTWCRADSPIPDQTFQDRYGTHGERLEGCLVCPVRSPKGEVIGFEGRSTQRKYITDFRLPPSAWNPFWLGTKTAMPKIWSGGDVWIVEGLFDLCPLQWAIPQEDAILASVRAHLSRNHVEFLRRFCKGWVNMVYDRDETGRKATHGYTDDQGKRHWGALDNLQRVGLDCRDKPYSGGTDPGEIWDLGGAPAIKKAFPL